MGEEIKVTFEALYDILREEKKKEEVFDLEDSFFDDVVDYIKEKKKLLESKGEEDDLFAVGEKDKIEDELKNIKRILKELYERREKKIIDMALNKSRTGSDIIDKSILLKEEQMFFDELLNIFNRYRRGVLGSLFTAEKPEIDKVISGKKEEKEVEKKEETEQEEKKERKETEKEEERKIGVRITHPVPKFLGKELEVYGPFEEDEVVDLPEKIAKILIEKDRAEEIETEE